MAASAIAPAPSASVPAHFIADLYSFQWSEFNFRLPLISALAVALCLFVGIAVGHPGGGLVAGGGAFTIGFGANQRIADSRSIPMIAAILATSAAALVGTLVGHNSSWLVAATVASAVIYGVMTARDTGVSWVGQQAIIALLVASAFPNGTKAAFTRAGLLAAGGTVQLLITSAGLKLLPNLRKDLFWIASTVRNTTSEWEWGFLGQLRELRHSLPSLSMGDTFAYCVRLALTMFVATEIYRRAGIQSGYWIPMTALLVQKPAFFETLARALGRIAGTLAGAWLFSLIIAHMAPGPVFLAVMATAFALLAFATVSVNYALFSVCITGYIVFLLSLNQIPGPVIAHRRAWCTTLGGLIALVIHIDALRRKRKKAEKTSPKAPAKHAEG
jgi:Fusaric acid resistance protein-like